MIKQIVELFYKVAEQHKLVRSFKYARLSKEAGTGEDNHPLLFLEDPIYVGSSSSKEGTVKVTVNFDVVIIPQAFSNFNVKQLSVEDCQSVSESIALNVIAKIRDMYGHYEEYGIDFVAMPVEWSFVTLRQWYDDKSAGVRCTLVLSCKNPINFCDLEEHFDEKKKFNISDLLSDIDTDNAEGCSATFDYKLPQFTM